MPPLSVYNTLIYRFFSGILGIKNIDTGECLMIDTRESLNDTLELLYKIKRY